MPIYPYKFPENTNKNNNLPTLNPYPYHHIVAYQQHVCDGN